MFTIGAGACGGQQKVLALLELERQVDTKSKCWESNPAPLQEQQVSLATEPSGHWEIPWAWSIDCSKSQSQLSHGYGRISWFFTFLTCSFYPYFSWDGVRNGNSEDLGGIKKDGWLNVQIFISNPFARLQWKKRNLQINTQIDDFGKFWKIRKLYKESKGALSQQLTRQHSVNPIGLVSAAVFTVTSIRFATMSRLLGPTLCFECHVWSGACKGPWMLSHWLPRTIDRSVPIWFKLSDVIVCTRLFLFGLQQTPKSWHGDLLLVLNAWPGLGLFLAGDFKLI